MCAQGRRELGGGPGQIFLGAPVSIFFSGKMFSNNTDRQPPPPPPPHVDNFLGGNFSARVRCNCFPAIFHIEFRYFAQKKQISCTLRGNISPQKMTGAQQKNSRGPPEPGRPGQFPSPPPPPPRRPCVC